MRKIGIQQIEDIALGASLLGAGGGGFLLFYVPEEKRNAVREALAGLLFVPFKFENDGTRVIYYAPEDCASEQTQTDESR